MNHKRETTAKWIYEDMLPEVIINLQEHSICLIKDNGRHKKQPETVVDSAVLLFILFYALLRWTKMLTSSQMKSPDLPLNTSERLLCL